MQYTPEMDSAIPSKPIQLDSAWDERLAKWVSDLLSPPLMALSGILIATWQIRDPNAWLWAGYYLSMTVLLPVVYILWKVHRGEITDFHIRRREQRIRPMALTLASATFAWATMWLGGAPTALIVFGGMGIFQIAFFLMVTFSWKISGHGVAISSLAMLVWSIYGGAASLAMLAIPLVAWARIRLRRHTPLQTLVGSITGILFMLSVLYVINLSCHGFHTFCK